VSLGSLAKGESSSYVANPLDLIKNVKVDENSLLNQIIIGHLDYRYKLKEKDTSFVIDYDEIHHIVKGSTSDLVTIKTLRGPCSGRNSYQVSSPQVYPFIPSPGMCVSKLTATDKNGNQISSPDNKACLIVKYYRT
jgi:hypothetical protein